MSNNVRLDTSVLDGLIKSTPDNLDSWLRGVAIEITTDIKLSFNTSPPGRAYSRGSKWHIASQAGNPPNIDYGNLINGMGWDRVGPLSFIIYAQADYAPYLELGTERMHKRPFFTPVFEAWRRAKLLDSARNARLIK